MARVLLALLAVGLAVVAATPGDRFGRGPGEPDGIQGDQGAAGGKVVYYRDVDQHGGQDDPRVHGPYGPPHGQGQQHDQHHGLFDKLKNKLHHAEHWVKDKATEIKHKASVLAHKIKGMYEKDKEWVKNEKGHVVNGLREAIRLGQQGRIGDAVKSAGHVLGGELHSAEHILQGQTSQLANDAHSLANQGHERGQKHNGPAW